MTDGDAAFAWLQAMPTAQTDPAFRNALAKVIGDSCGNPGAGSAFAAVLMNVF